MRPALFRAIVGAIQTADEAVQRAPDALPRLKFLREVFRGGPARLRASIIGSVGGE